MNEFAEIEAMKAIMIAMEPLEEAIRERVLRWACDKYKVAGANARTRMAYAEPGGSTESNEVGAEVPVYDTAAELLAAAGADTDADKALVVGYWYQVVLNQSDIESQAINTELKHIGYGVGNITRALDSLVNQRPQLVIQLRKGGASKQARKKFKLTAEGIRRVKQMISGNGGSYNE